MSQPTFEVLTEDFNSPTLGRFLLLVLDDLLALQNLPETSAHFALFSAFDVSALSNDKLRTLAEHLVAKGLAYASCWGEDCERWHDAIDCARDRDYPDDTNLHDILMTTWHDGEPLEDALMFFGRLAIPTPMYADGCRDYILATSPNYADIVRSCFRGGSIKNLSEVDS